jgi:alpha-mannosidase
MATRIPLYYTFGNHMHWVDMEWLWGYGVLPDSVRDMLHFCDATGARGNVNFDAIGYEKMAVEAPDALDALRQAVARGQVEVVGASYGQPYGLFHGGESNIRQRVQGARTVMRLLGVRPRTFWEEEFDFFPQLPQMLRGVGHDYASLFFQWTWHTPSVPVEDTPVIWWEGQDGSRLLTAPRNALNLHQWPEDFQGLLESDAWRHMPAPAIVQWLELMPSPDWMCRSEVLLPPMRELLARPEFDIRPVTLSEYLEQARPHATPRRYTLDDVFHGVSLGKNGDRLRRMSRQGEQDLLTAESLSALCGFFGRPYPSWDVYPTWELEEAWRELLSAQHHDNDECEGLCGFVGVLSYARSAGLAANVIERSLASLAKRLQGPFVYNPLGWARDAAVRDPDTGQDIVVRDVPPFGYRTIAGAGREITPSAAVVLQSDGALTLRRGALSVTVDPARGVITQMTSAHFPDGLLREDRPLAELEMLRDGVPERFEAARVDVPSMTAGSRQQVHVTRAGRDGHVVRVIMSLAPELDAVDIEYLSQSLPRPDGRMHAALQTRIAPDLPGARLIHDHPYGVSEIRAQGTFVRKYPTGDWMTSPQVFEEVRNPFTALQLLDFDAGERGLLLLHDGSQAFFRQDDGVRQILSMYDPWDEDFFCDRLDARVRLVPHGRFEHAQRWRLAQQFTRPGRMGMGSAAYSELPPQFGVGWCDADNVAVTALYREQPASGAGRHDQLGRVPEVHYPYIVRLVEFNGAAATARLRVPGRVASAYRTNLLGEILSALAVSPAQPPGDGGPREWSEVPVAMRPFEIATLYLDLELGRKMTRDLDAHRNVWATIHRVSGQE